MKRSNALAVNDKGWFASFEAFEDSFASFKGFEGLFALYLV